MQGLTQNSFLICQFSYFAKANIPLLTYDSFFRFILLLSGSINVNLGPTTVNNNRISLNTLPFHNCGEPVNNNSISLNTLQFHNCGEPTMPSKCNSSGC